MHGCYDEKSPTPEILDSNTCSNTDFMLLCWLHNGGAAILLLSLLVSAHIWIVVVVVACCASEGDGGEEGRGAVWVYLHNGHFQVVCGMLMLCSEAWWLASWYQW